MTNIVDLDIEFRNKLFQVMAYTQGDYELRRIMIKDITCQLLNFLELKQFAGYLEDIWN